MLARLHLLHVHGLRRVLESHQVVVALRHKLDAWLLLSSMEVISEATNLLRHSLRLLVMHRHAVLLHPMELWRLHSVLVIILKLLLINIALISRKWIEFRILREEWGALLRHLVWSRAVDAIELRGEWLHAVNLLLHRSAVPHWRVWERVGLVLRSEMSEVDGLGVVRVLHEALLLPDEWLHLALLPLDDLGHGLVEEVASGIHSPGRVFLAVGAVPLGAAGDGPLVAVHAVLEVRHPLVGTLVARRAQMRLHLNLDCPTSGDPSLLLLVTFDHRILNYKIIMELLRHRIGFGHRGALHLEVVEALLNLVVGLSGIGLVVRRLRGNTVVVHGDVDVLHHVLDVAASEVPDLVEEIVIVFDVISRVIAIIGVNYLRAALVIQLHVDVGGLNSLGSGRLLLHVEARLSAERPFLNLLLQGRSFFNGALLG